MGSGNKDPAGTEANGAEIDNHPEGTRLGHYVLGKLKTLLNWNEIINLSFQAFP